MAPATLRANLVWIEFHTFRWAQGTDLACLYPAACVIRLHCPGDALGVRGTSATLGGPEFPRGDVLHYRRPDLLEQLRGGGADRGGRLTPEEVFSAPHRLRG